MANLLGEFALVRVGKYEKKYFLVISYTRQETFFPIIFFPFRFASFVVNITVLESLEKQKARNFSQADIFVKVRNKI